jgi:hypothetical protein
LEAALGVYERAMFSRSQAEYADARELVELCPGERAPFGLIEFFKGAAA